jgi:glycosyltransferase involved in cell wall biosynthesis
MQTPTVSICLPVYNGANFLAEAIRSALAQEFADFELLIGNDCSTDQTKSIIESFASQDPRIKPWTNKSNLKLFGNYNACIERASGKYIKPFAHDDLFEPTLLGNMVSVLEGNPDISLVSSARHWIDATGKIIEPNSDVSSKTMRPFTRNTRLSAPEAITSTLVEVSNWLGEPSSQMFRKECSDGGYDTSFRQIGDLEYSYRLLNRGDYYFLADDYCYLRRHSEDWSTARGLDFSALMDWFLLGSKYKSFLDSVDLSSEEFCLNLARVLTCTFESTLYHSHRLEKEHRLAVLRTLCDGNDPLSFFECDKNAERDLLTESRGIAVISFLHSTILENELRLVNRKVSQPHSDCDGEMSGNVRTGIARALDGMQNKLREQDKEISALRESLSEIGNSLSWKVTTPLRMLKALLS